MWMSVYGFQGLSPATELTQKDVPMKKTLPMLLTIAAVILLCPMAFANTTQAQKSTPPGDVASAAAAVPLALNSTINLSDEEILEAASPVQVSVQGAALHGLAIKAANEVEGPETAGPDSDGPGGPDHQFEGEETGNH